LRGWALRSTVASACPPDGFDVAAKAITSGRVSVPREATGLPLSSCASM
jgi:hypothetical protein